MWKNRLSVLIILLIILLASLWLNSVRVKSVYFNNWPMHKDNYPITHEGSYQ